MVRVKCEVEPTQSYEDSLLASAYQDHLRNTVLVLVNLSREERRCDLGSAGTVDVYTTSALWNLALTEQPAADIVIPARAAATVCGRVY